MYEHSNFLLTKIYNEFLGKINKDSVSVKKEKDGIKNINPSPHWRLLAEYGGNFTIKEFRENFNKTQYEFHDTVSFRTKFKPLATLFEEKINF